MKRILFAAAIIVIAASCAHEKTPVEQAITDRLMEMTPGITDVTFETVELIDSTTLGEEIAYREKIFNVKCQLNTKHYQKYLAKGDNYKAAERRDALLNDQKILQGIGALREGMKADLNKIVYYDYKFSAIITKDGSKIQAKDYFACITPENKVLKYTQDQKDLHKGVGSVIPGYTDLLGGTEE